MVFLEAENYPTTLSQNQGCDISRFQQLLLKQQIIPKLKTLPVFASIGDEERRALHVLNDKKYKDLLGLFPE